MTTSASGARGRPWTVRLAAWSARHRWPVMAAWLAAAVALFLASQAAGGMRAASATSGAELSQTESGRAIAAMQAGADGAPVDMLNVVIASDALPAADPEFHRTVTTVLDRLRAVTAVVGGTSGPALAGLEDPYAAPAGAGLVSPDGAAVRLVGRIEGDTAAMESRTRAVAPVLDALRAELPAFGIHAYGSTLVTDQMAEEINRDLDGALGLSLPATFAILLVAFGALVAAVVPLVLAISALLGAFGLVGLFSQAVAPVSPYASQVIVLIGLAVAIDYSLFMITRFRGERRRGRDVMAAIEASSATAGRAVFFSGVAVMVSLAGLFLLPVAVFQSMAAGSIAVILVSVLGSLMFLPAVLAILGDGIDRGAIPVLRRNGTGAGRGWARVVGTVMRHPLVAAIAATAVLLAAASPVIRLRLGEPDITIMPDRLDAVQAVDALRTHWPAGTLLTLDVVVAGEDGAPREEAVQGLAAALTGVRGLSGPARIVTSPDGSAASVSVLMSGSANDPANRDIVRHVRSAIVPAAAAAAPRAALSVGGAAAYSLDQTAIFTDGLIRIVLFVLGLSFVLLLLVFHSIAIPLKAIALNLLATGAAFGALVLVFQEGWFAGRLGIRPGEITHFIPIFVFAILFGLSMDYEVFILARIKEARDQGLDSREAVAEGIAATAGTVTSAAAIMVVVFAVFLTLPLGIARQLGLGLGVAVLVDATIVRIVLLPATMRLLGDWNWWLPGFLRWLPRITVEDAGAAGGEPAGDAPDAGAIGSRGSVPDVAMLPSGTGVGRR